MSTDPTQPYTESFAAIDPDHLSEQAIEPLPQNYPIHSQPDIDTLNHIHKLTTTSLKQHHELELHQADQSHIHKHKLQSLKTIQQEEQRMLQQLHHAYAQRIQQEHNPAVIQQLTNEYHLELLEILDKTFQERRTLNLPTRFEKGIARSFRRMLKELFRHYAKKRFALQPVKLSKSSSQLLPPQKNQFLFGHHKKRKKLFSQLPAYETSLTLHHAN